MPAWMSWSSGKDSAYALHVARSELSIDVSGLLCTMNASVDRVSMHAVRRALLGLQAESLGMPLRTIELPAGASFELYDAELRRAAHAAEAEGVSTMVFGDLFLEDVQAYRHRSLAETRIEPLFPLWMRPTDQLARDIVDGGVRAVVTCVDMSVLSSEFAGRPFDEDFLHDLPAGVDPCGERGEFHTFVWDGPGFRRPIEIEVGERVARDGFMFCDVVPSTVSVQ